MTKWTPEQCRMFAEENAGREASAENRRGLIVSGKVLSPGIWSNDKLRLLDEDGTGWYIDDPATVKFLDGEPERAPMVGDLKTWCGTAIGWQGCTRPKGHPPTVHVHHDSDGNELDREPVTDSAPVAETITVAGKSVDVAVVSVTWEPAPDPFLIAVDKAWRLASGDPGTSKETREALRALTPMLAQRVGKSGK